MGVYEGPSIHTRDGGDEDRIKLNVPFEGSFLGAFSKQPLDSFFLLMLTADLGMGLLLCGSVCSHGMRCQRQNNDCLLLLLPKGGDAAEEVHKQKIVGKAGKLGSLEWSRDEEDLGEEGSSSYIITCVVCP